MEEYDEEYKGMPILLRKGEDGWGWTALPIKMLGDKALSSSLGGGGGEFPTKEAALKDAQRAIDQWLFRHQ
jgi:hypothetical protein